MNNNIPIIDKIAIIFHGIVGGINGRNGVGPPNNISDCAKTIKYNITSKYDTDIFVHSWSLSHAEEIVNLYNPKLSLFQPQEYFGFSENHATDHPTDGQAFRTTSRYTSLERAMGLKQQYENTNNFKYKWIIVLRYDVVFFNPLNLSIYDPTYMYICSEPHWINTSSLFHDIIFMSNSDIMNAFTNFGTELKNGLYNPSDTHAAIYNKVLTMFNNDSSMVKKSFRRYNDIEIYRMIINPELNPIGHAYGALETKPRLEALLKQINNDRND